MNFTSRKLMTIPAWIEKNFESGSGPKTSTVRRWCRQGVLPCKRIGKQWFVISNYQPESSTGNAEADRLIAEIGAAL